MSLRLDFFVFFFFSQGFGKVQQSAFSRCDGFTKKNVNQGKPSHLYSADFYTWDKERVKNIRLNVKVLHQLTKNQMKKKKHMRK